MRILRVAARLVMCGSSVSMSWRAAKTILPPALACANAVRGASDVAAGARRSSATAAIVLMLVSSRSRAELMGRVRDRSRRRHQILQGHALVRRGPFLVDADVARTVLHGRDAVGCQDIAVADVAEPSPAAHHGPRPRREPLALGQRGYELGRG